MSIKIQKNVSLAKYTSFKIGGPAKFFCVVENNDEIKEALEFAKKNKLNIFILGGGSNLLISDKGFNGLMIKIQNSKFKIQNSNIICGAGLPLAKLISETINANLTGMEWAAGIPGTVGGAIVNNTGAFGKCIGDVVESVEILEKTPPNLPHSAIAQGKLLSGEELSPPDKGGWGVRIFTNKQCNFSYRNSLFKEEKKYIILNVVLKLKKGNEAESRKMILEILKLRKEKQPLEYPSAGSVFKNPVLDDDHFKKLIKKYPELENISVNRDLVSTLETKSLIIPAGWLIEQIDELKNKKIGGAMISEKHCNFIVNTGNAKAEDVVILISLIKQKVRNNFGIQLKEEIEYVGF